MQGKSVQQAQVDIDTRYQEISYRQFIDPSFRVAGRPKMRFVYLYTAPGKRTITKTWQHKKAGGSVRPPQSKEVHSFHVFAVPGTPHIALMFQDTAKQTQEFLRYSDTIRPGDEVWIPRAKEDGSVGQNPLIKHNQEAMIFYSGDKQLII